MAEARGCALLSAVIILALTAGPAGARPSVNHLIKQLSVATGDAQLRVIRALGRTDQAKAGAALLPLLNVRQDSPRRSVVIVEALGRLGERKAAEPLLAAWDYLLGLRLQLDLTAQVQVLRGAVVEALGGVGGEGSARILLEALNDADPVVVEKAVRALGRLRERKAIEPLSELSERGGSIGQAAFEALGEIDREQCVAALERGLRRENALEAMTAAYGLARMGRKEGLRRLEETVENGMIGDKAAFLAAYYLTKLDRRQGLDFLTNSIDAEGSDQQLPAIEALGKAGNDRAVLPLIEAAAETADPNVKAAAARSLGRLGGTRAVKALQALKADSSLTVRAAATMALEELGED